MLKAIATVALLGVSLPLTALAQSAKDPKNGALTTGDVPIYGMGYSQQRFSPLTQINRDTVKRLVPAWSYSMADNRGEEAQALVKDGVVYFTDHSKTVAVDALTGKEIWKSVIDYPPATTRMVCCGIVNRGGAPFEGSSTGPPSMRT
jgi:alcohol dehydrogenase (cytochrome c)